MRQLIIILTATVVLWSCEKQKEQIEKFVFDNKQISSRTIHKYEFYSDGRVKTNNAVTHYIMAGLPFDSTVSKQLFTYNSKGKLESIFDPTDSTKQVKFYNELDSLITDLRINKYGDTTFLAKIQIQNGKETRRINRMLSLKFPENPDDFKTMNIRNYDTLYFLTESIYHDGQLDKTISKDKDGNVTEETQFIYDGDKKTKTLKYSFLGASKYLSETTNYINNNSKEPDYITIGTQEDTVAYKTTLLQDEMRIVVNYFGQFNSQNIWYYDKKNRLVGMVDLNLTERVKQVYSYKYDDKGNTLEELNYKERISNAR